MAALQNGDEMNPIKGIASTASIHGPASSITTGSASTPAPISRTRSTSAPAALAALVEKQSARTISLKSGTPKGFEHQQQAIAPLIERRKGEQESFDKWNPNARGRNQGLVHVIDYAYARPPATKVDVRLHKEEVMGPHRTLTGSGVISALHASGLRTDAERKKPEQAFNPAKLGLMSPAPRYSDEITAKQEQVSAIASTEKKEGRDPTKNPEFKKLSGELKALEAKSRLDSSYVFQTDESKKGRIDLVDKSAGRDVRTREQRDLMADRNKSAVARSEINDVTDELDRLQAHSGTQTKKTDPTGNPVTLNDRWVKAQEATEDKSAQWVRRTETVADASVKSQQVTNSNSSKLRIQSWGPDEESMKYSTVMGN